MARPPMDTIPPSASALQAQIDKLRPAKVSFQSPDTLFVDQPAKVSVIITPTSSAPTPNPNGQPVVPDTTRISEVTQVCLSAAGFRVENEAGEEKGCRDQPISLRNPSTWSWILTPLSQIQVSGARPVTLTVNAILVRYSPYTVYSSTHNTFVEVRSPSIMKRIQAFLDEWKALLATIAGIVAVLLPLIKWLRSRRT